MDKHLSKLLILFVVVVLGVIGIFAVKNRDQKPKNLPELLAAPIATPSPSSSNVTKIGSPDGQKTLEMLEKKDGAETTYTVSVSGEDGVANVVFSKTYDSGWSVSIPYNTFSPDNKYFFLKVNGPSTVSYIVVNSTGAVVSRDNQTIEIVGRFEAKETNYKITDVTGWAAPTLMVINTNKNDGGLGPSFWFDLSDTSFIPLSTRFN